MKARIIRDIDKDCLLFGGSLYVSNVEENNSDISIFDLLSLRGNVFEQKLNEKISSYESRKPLLPTPDERKAEIDKYFSEAADTDAQYILMTESGIRGDKYNLEECSILTILLKGNISLGFVVDKLVVDALFRDTGGVTWG